MSTWTMTGSGYFAASNRPLRDTKLAPNAPPLEPALLGSATSPAAKGAQRSCITQHAFSSEIE